MKVVDRLKELLDVNIVDDFSPVDLLTIASNILKEKIITVNGLIPGDRVFVASESGEGEVLLNKIAESSSERAYVNSEDQLVVRMRNPKMLPFETRLTPTEDTNVAVIRVMDKIHF